MLRTNNFYMNQPEEGHQGEPTDLIIGGVSDGGNACYLDQPCFYRGRDGVHFWLWQSNHVVNRRVCPWSCVINLGRHHRDLTRF